MNPNELRINQTVWIKNGLDQGKRGKVRSRGFGAVSVELDGETKVFSQSAVTTEDPNNIPLPPNFHPHKYNVGDRVKSQGYWDERFNGITGKVTKVPVTNSISRPFEERSYTIEVIKDPKKVYDSGKVLNFKEDMLNLAPAERIEGEEIEHADVKIGDVIRTIMESSVEGYTQSSSKEGKVDRIVTKSNTTYDLDPHEKYTFYTRKSNGNTLSLNYNNKGEKIILVKEGESPYAAILKGLGAGSVVTFEKDNGEVITYVKAKDGISETNKNVWHEITSCSTHSSVTVGETRVVEALDNGGEILHKVRKPSVPTPPPFGNPWSR